MSAALAHSMILAVTAATDDHPSTSASTYVSTPAIVRVIVTAASPRMSR